MDISGTLFTASTWVLPVLIAITFHEAAHAYVAWKLGDDTAYRLGRVTFNPLRHVDPFGTVILPAILFLSGSPFLFGWAKPVPVTFGRLRNPRGHMVLVAGAGPAINVVLAVISALLLRFVGDLPEAWQVWASQTLLHSVLLNLILAIFNMIPIPPLDGGRIAVGLLPDFLAYPLSRLERFGMLIVIAIVILLPLLGSQIGADLNFFSHVIGGVLKRLMPIISAIAGFN